MDKSDTQTIHPDERECDDRIRALHALSYEVIQFQLSRLEGEILTLIEASASDSEQRKAQKDLAKLLFRKKYNWLKELCYGPGVDSTLN